MISFPPAVQKLIKELSKLPSVGEKSAARLAYHLVQTNPELSRNLAAALLQASEKVKMCEECFFMSEQPLCAVCSDPRRDATQICVVEKPVDVIALERMGEFRGLYHVLHGLWAPLRGVGPEKMKVKELVTRIDKGTCREIILATNSTVEGEATALYISRILAEKNVSCSRPAQGMPRGAELEYADEMTLSKAFLGRQIFGKAA